MATQVRFRVNLLWHCLIFCEKRRGGVLRQKGLGGAETKGRGDAETNGGGGAETKRGGSEKGGGGCAPPEPPPPLNPPVN